MKIWLGTAAVPEWMFNEEQTNDTLGEMETRPKTGFQRPIVSDPNGTKDQSSVIVLIIYLHF